MIYSCDVCLFEQGSLAVRQCVYSSLDDVMKPASVLLFAFIAFTQCLHGEHTEWIHRKKTPTCLVGATFKRLNGSLSRMIQFKKQKEFQGNFYVGEQK